MHYLLFICLLIHLSAICSKVTRIYVISSSWILANMRAMLVKPTWHLVSRLLCVFLVSFRVIRSRPSKPHTVQNQRYYVFIQPQRTQIFVEFSQAWPSSSSE